MKHTCHARGCGRRCKPEHLMCRKHWGMVPEPIKRMVNQAYRPGQCTSKRPSKEWRTAAHAAVASVTLQEFADTRKVTLFGLRALAEVAPHLLPADAAEVIAEREEAVRRMQQASGGET